MKKRHLFAAAVVAAAAGVSGLAWAQGAANPAKGEVEVRRATFKLIGANFGPLGAVVKGEAPYDAAQAKKHIERLVFLAGTLPDVFPASSNIGEPDTKAKPDIWTKRADFDALVKKLQTDLAALQEVNAKDPTGGASFKAAFVAVAQNCKSCHEDFKVK